MSPRDQSTEIDQLLPSPKEQRRPKSAHEYSDQSRRRVRCAVIAAASLVILGIFNVLTKPASHKYKKTVERTYKPSKQLKYLNQLTGDALANLAQAGANVNVAPLVAVDAQLTAAAPPANTVECSSQIMIMRHCDKDVQVRDKHGKVRIRDKRDFFGDGHCSSKGKERSAYIATLFVENDEFQGLVNGTKESVDILSDEGVPPIPAVNATEVAFDAIKPQFPTPLKIYALNDARYNKNPNKEHQNFREVETVTPLADKFHLDVNETFGVNEEGDLATDFFTSLSKSVKMNVDRALIGANPAAGEDDISNGDLSTLRLCQNGMTVVNWKHSLIPNLANALGCGKEEGCPKKYRGQDFDTVWVITYKYSVPFNAAPQTPIVPPAVAVDTTAAAPLDVEALSKGSSNASKEKHHRQLKSNSSEGHGISWVITAQTVQEGFDQVY
ncbi:hypothetical protein ACHAWO_007318 [Cyclotella atomus]|jgi:hypothetical protein|uniref:Uncharacterized protein n=1 Tax=Cyclotella atomus TaxID=382360 RepID=A0ABD3QQM9_9STRA